MSDSNSQEDKYIGKYKILSIIGKGGMGVVYKGFDPHIERTVAIKTISMDFEAEHDDVEKWRKRFLREAKLAGNLSHPNIVTVYDVGEYSGGFYIAMEYIEGHSLRDLIVSPDHIPLEEFFNLIGQVFSGFSYAHQQGVIHCDIKPENIMIEESGKVVIVDFGIARPTASQLTAVNQSVFIGTPSYVSPERLSNAEPDIRSDIFSLGATLYEVLTKRKAFEGNSISSIITKILNEDPPKPSSIRSDLPKAIDSILEKALAKKPEGRYEDYQSFYDDLVACWAAHFSVGKDHGQENVATSFLGAEEVTEEIRFGRKGSPSVLDTRSGYGLQVPTGGRDVNGSYDKRAAIRRDKTKGSTFKRIAKWAFIMVVVLFFTGLSAIYLMKLWRNTRGGPGQASPVNQAEKELKVTEPTGIQGGSDELQETTSADRKQKMIDEYRAQGMAYLTKGNPLDAISAFEKVLELDPGNQEAKEKIEFAKGQVNKRLEADESFRKGVELMDKGNYEQAVSSFTKVLVLDPGNEAAKQKIDLAMKELSRGRAADENYRAGIKSMDDGDYSKAIAYFTRVLELDPGNQDARQKIELAKQSPSRKRDPSGVTTTPEEDRSIAEYRDLRLVYNQNCSGKTGLGEIFIDGRSYGMLTPGNEMTVQLVAGNHEVSMVDEQGYRWGPYTQSVLYGGGTRSFSCGSD